jgi:hypothetical protein
LSRRWQEPSPRQGRPQLTARVLSTLNEYEVAMNDHYVKYPRTRHLPWSLGRGRDDLVLDSVSRFESLEKTVVTEKLDGENTTLYRDGFHARSLDSKSHPARDWLKAYHAAFAYRIPESTRICGENMFAEHSISYTQLTTFFYVFAVYRGELCLDWEETVAFCRELNIETVPVLYEGPWDETKVRACWKGESVYGPEQEGYVVRNKSAFLLSEFGVNVAKFVREGHVGSEIHWMNAPVRPNRLKGA